MATQTITIQEFSQMMASGEKMLPNFVHEITKLARPEDVRLFSSDEDGEKEGRLITPLWGWF